MVTAAIAAAAAAVLLVTAFVAARWASARADRRFDAVVRQLDRHMDAISQNLQHAVERSQDVLGKGIGELGLSLDLRELLERVAMLASERTGAETTVVRVLGPAGTPATVSYGSEGDIELLEGALGPPDDRPFRALQLSWSYEPAIDPEDVGAYRSALVVPLLEAGRRTGALAAYRRSAGGFRPEHTHALEALAEEAAPAIANARRFAEAELRAVTDALTGVRNRRGYDEELDREVARARRTNRPLALLLLDLDDFGEVNARFDYPGGDIVLQEFAILLARLARATDTVCRRGGEEFAFLLPETSGAEGSQLDARLRAEVAGTAFTNVGRITFSGGLVEWRPNETPESLDARASAAVNRAKRAGKNRLEGDWS
jgi:diguanylate cyclase (GGDEF)-like protein